MRELVAIAVACAVLASMSLASEGEPRMELPMAQGRTFDDLDSYLAYRQELGAMDKPYYLLVGPELYQLIRGRALGGKPPELFTRAQLLKEFGFDR